MWIFMEISSELISMHELIDLKNKHALDAL